MMLRPPSDRTGTPAAAEPTWQYDLEDAAGEILYVGVTHDLHARMRQHRRKKAWWHEVELIQAMQWPTRVEALAWEAAFIRGAERPPYNIVVPRQVDLCRFDKAGDHWSARLLDTAQMTPDEVR